MILGRAAKQLPLVILFLALNVRSERGKVDDLRGEKGWDSCAPLPPLSRQCRRENQFVQQKQEQSVEARLQGTRQTEENKGIEEVSGWEGWADGAELFISAQSWSSRKADGASQKGSSGSLRFNPLGTGCLYRAVMAIGHGEVSSLSLRVHYASFFGQEEAQILPRDS